MHFIASNDAPHPPCNEGQSNGTICRLCLPLRTKRLCRSHLMTDFKDTLVFFALFLVTCVHSLQATDPQTVVGKSRLPSLSARVDAERSKNCYNFTVGNPAQNEFFSPNFPNNYSNDTECERVIKAPHGHQISIEFRDQFHLEEASNCEYDYLEVRDGAYGYSNVIAKLCGHEFPRDINSNDRYLFLRFVSDESIEYSGFRAVYSFKKLPTQRSEPPRECRFNKSGVSGVIKHSEIPQELYNYSHAEQTALDCIWNITIQQGYKMYLNFKNYKLQTPNNCEANYIDIYNDKLSESDLVTRFCGTQAESLTSKSNQMNIRFFAKPEALSAQNPPEFEIIFTAFRALQAKESCRLDEFDCDDMTCIDISLKCDGRDNCKYRYDEEKQTTCAPINRGLFNFSSQHMIVIMVVFCALVLGMCASITISCWSKIQERRQRKRDYKLRRSRETSMEVGLDRTMTITSLDRSALEHEIAAQQSVMGSGGRTRKIITANAITRKSGFRDEELNGCYVPDMDLNMYRKQPNGGTQAMLSDDKFCSPDSPPHLMGNQIPSDCQHYYSQQRDSIRSSSESPIPPPPPPPVLSHMRNRQRTVPLDATKLDSCSPSNDNQLMEQSLVVNQSVPQMPMQMHRPDCAQHNAPDYSQHLRDLRPKPEYSRSASVPLGHHVSVIDGSDNINEDEEEFCADDDEDAAVPLNSRTRFRAEAVIEMGGGTLGPHPQHRQRSFETTRSAPDVVIMR